MSINIGDKRYAWCEPPALFDIGPCMCTVTVERVCSWGDYLEVREEFGGFSQRIFMSRANFLAMFEAEWEADRAAPDLSGWKLRLSVVGSAT